VGIQEDFGTKLLRNVARRSFVSDLQSLSSDSFVHIVADRERHRHHASPRAYATQATKDARVEVRNDGSILSRCIFKDIIIDDDACGIKKSGRQ
jgi:hypothetical protein